MLEREKVKFVVLTGSTPVDARQSLVDEFTEDESIEVFLLSTKAGGMGINLTAASVVVMYVLSLSYPAGLANFRPLQVRPGFQSS